MTELCSEIENMNLANEHFSFLKDIYNDFAKYTKQYKSIASEYSKKMGQLQEKYSFPLIDVYKSKKKYSNINTLLICSITSIIPKVIKQLILNEFNKQFASLLNWTNFNLNLELILSIFFPLKKLLFILKV